MNEQCDLSGFAIGTVASTPSIVSSKRNWIQEESTPFCSFFICVIRYVVCNPFVQPRGADFLNYVNEVNSATGR